MAIYEYTCSRCGDFDVRLALGTAPQTCACPTCAQPARRVFSVPGLAATSKTVLTHREREERSGEAPEVVSEVPRGRRTARRSHPALARLPRP
jgi:putative regulatory protein, FmdB family